MSKNWLGQSADTIGDVMVALAEAASDGTFFNNPIAPTIQQHARVYTEAQRARLRALGVELPTQCAPVVKGASVGAFKGVHAKRALMNRLEELAGPGRAFLSEPTGDLFSVTRKRPIGKNAEVTFSCTKCHIVHTCTLLKLADAELGPASFRCLCAHPFAHKDALSRKGEVAFRNLKTYVRRRIINTELATTREEFLANRTNVVLRCTRCAATRRMLPREVFGPVELCACAPRSSFVAA